MADAYLGEIRAFAGGYAPEGWLICNGSLQAISSNEALFTLIGTTYGGDGMNTFGLPNLMGRLVIGMGQGAGLTNRPQGSTGGAEAVAIATAHLPTHTHTFTVSTATGTPSVNTPSSATYLGAMASTGGTVIGYVAGNTPNITPTALHASTVSTTGNSSPHDNRMPHAAINYIICTAGLYPSRA